MTIRYISYIHWDPLSKRVMELRDDGNEVYVFEETPAGYVTSEGLALDTIMMRCRNDEGFRRQCTVLIPVYENSLSGQRPVVKYHIFQRPLPGIMPTRLPRLALNESLSYRTVWKHAELGELVNAINLAPGEQREISISRSYQSETTASETTTSVFELASSETSDVSTEMERIARTENELKTYVDSKQSASISIPLIDGITGSASSGLNYGASDTLKTFGQSMNKIAKKAAKSVNQKNRQEVSSTSTQKTTISNTDSTVIKISNVNQGRSLNLMFYKIYNRFSTGLYLEDLQFQVTSGVELLAGSGIYDTKIFRLDDVAGMLAMLNRTPLPLDSDAEAIAGYHLSVLHEIERLLNLEYVKKPAEPESRPAKRKKGPFAASVTGNATPGTIAAAGSANILAFSKTFDMPAPAMGDMAPAAPKKGAKEITVNRDNLHDSIEGLSDVYQTLQIDNVAMGAAGADTSDILVASPGLYLDSIVGARPATEPYSEEMRAQEVRMRAAEVFSTEANAQYQLAQAERIARMGSLGSSPSGNIIIGALPDETYTSLTIRLKLPLGPGKWSLWFDGKPVPNGTLSAAQRERTVITVNVAGRRAPDWIKADDLLDRIALHDGATEDLISAAR